MNNNLNLILFIFTIVTLSVFVSCSKPLNPVPEVSLQKDDGFGEYTFRSVGENVNASSWSFGIIGEAIAESDEQEVVTEDLQSIYTRTFFGNEVKFRFYTNDTSKAILFVSHQENLDSTVFDIEVNDVPTKMRIDKIKLTTEDFDTNQVSMKIYQENYDRGYYGLPEVLPQFVSEHDIVVQDTILLDSVEVPLYDFDFRHVYFDGNENMRIAFFSDADSLFEVNFDMKRMVPSQIIFSSTGWNYTDWYPNTIEAIWGSKKLELFVSYIR